MTRLCKAVRTAAVKLECKKHTCIQLFYCRNQHVYITIYYISMFGFVCVFAFFVLMMCLVFVGFTTVFTTVILS